MTKSLGKGRGRPLGAKNKRTLALQEASMVVSERLEREIPEAWSGDAHALLMSIYKDPALPIQPRLDAASKALPYEKPRVAPVDYAPQVASREPVTIFHRLDQASMDKILELVK